jgi:hypothetical protein
MLVKSTFLALTIACVTPSWANANDHRNTPVLTHELVGENRYLFDAVLSSGTQVRHVVYMKERLGGRWWLQIRHVMGLVVGAPTGEEISALTQADARELMEMLFEAIHRDHGGRLDEVQIDVRSIESLRESGITYLRDAKIPLKHDVFKSGLLLRTAIGWLQSEDFVRNACVDLSFVGMKCQQRTIGMNALAFRHELRLKHWQDAMDVPDLGIQWDSMWFAIDLEPVAH